MTGIDFQFVCISQSHILNGRVEGYFWQNKPCVFLFSFIYMVSSSDSLRVSIEKFRCGDEDGVQTLRCSVGICSAGLLRLAVFQVFQKFE